MVNFKRAFGELKEPVLWLHYALGVALIVGAYYLLINEPLFPELSLMTLLKYYAVYVIVDRTVHGILELF